MQLRGAIGVIQLAPYSFLGSACSVFPLDPCAHLAYPAAPGCMLKPACPQREHRGSNQQHLGQPLHKHARRLQSQRDMAPSLCWSYLLSRRCLHSPHAPVPHAVLTSDAMLYIPCHPSHVVPYAACILCSMPCSILCSMPCPIPCPMPSPMLRPTSRCP